MVLICGGTVHVCNVMIDRRSQRIQNGGLRIFGRGEGEVTCGILYISKFRKEVGGIESGLSRRSGGFFRPCLGTLFLEAAEVKRSRLIE